MNTKEPCASNDGLGNREAGRSAGRPLGYTHICGWIGTAARSCGSPEMGDDAGDAEEEEAVEVVVDEQGGQDGHGEAEVVLLHYVARPSVDQEQEAAQGEVEHAAGGGQADADGVEAPALVTEAGNGARADHAVGLVLERVPGVQVLERRIQVLPCAGVNNRLATSVICSVFGTLRRRWATS